MNKHVKLSRPVLLGLMLASTVLVPVTTRADEKLRVSVHVTAGDENSRTVVTSTIASELRQLGDVEPVGGTEDSLFGISAAVTPFGDNLIGVAIAVTWEFKCESNDYGASDFRELYIIGATTENIRSQIARVVASVDTRVFETARVARRKVDR